MRALSLWRPWNWAFVHADKHVENRGREITFRGDVVFQAAKRFDRDAVPFIQRVANAGGFGLCPGEPTMHPAGVLAFVGEIVDCVQIDDFSRLGRTHDREWMNRQNLWAFGPWCAIVENIRPLKPLPWKGSRGWFDIPENVVTEALG